MDQDKHEPGRATAAPLDAGPSYVLRLYVTGTTARSAGAIANLRRICDEHLEGRYVLEVIDIYQYPEAAREHQIIAAPTLVKLLPEPIRRIIGDLSDDVRVLAGLDLQPRSNPTGRPGA